MKLAIISSRYPTPIAPYNHMFVHTRNKWYQKAGASVQVFVPAGKKESYQVDSISVERAPVTHIVKKIKNFDVVLIHLLHLSPIKEINGEYIYDYLIKNNFPALFFLHGIESKRLWRSRKNDIDFSSLRSMGRFVYRDFYHFPRVRDIVIRILENTTRIRFVTVSNWKKRDIEETFKIVIAPGRIKVIHNGIDTRRFAFQEHWSKRSRILAIRPLFMKGNYAVDLALDTMPYLKNKGLSLSLYGKGADEQKILNYIRKHRLTDRVKVYNEFISHDEVPDIHGRFGIYYAVTRSDTQGVSMCEAMSSGLPTVSFNTTAIPEFIKDGESGLLIDDFDVKVAAAKIELLANDREMFWSIAENGRKEMEKIDIQKTTQAELLLAANVAGDNFSSIEAN